MSVRSQHAASFFIQLRARWPTLACRSVALRRSSLSNVRTAAIKAPTTAIHTTQLSRATRQAEVVSALRAELPAHALLWQSEDTVPYECDGLTAYRERPLVVALPETEAQVAAVLRTCHAMSVPVVARGAGTGLSGGAMPHAMGVTLSLAKFNHIVSIDPRSRTAVVQGGVRNLAISEAAAPHGL